MCTTAVRCRPAPELPAVQPVGGPLPRLGTEKLEVESRSASRLRVRRMDSDTMRRPGSHAKVLSAFRRGQVHFLLGTQMIAKGLDFPNVTLVG